MAIICCPKVLNGPTDPLRMLVPLIKASAAEMSQSGALAPLSMLSLVAMSWCARMTRALPSPG